MKTAKEVTDIIMKALNMGDAPEGILVEAFLSKWEKDIRNDAVQSVEVKDEAIPKTLGGYVVDWNSKTVSLPYDLPHNEYLEMKELCHQHKVRIQLSL